MLSLHKKFARNDSNKYKNPSMTESGHGNLRGWSYKNKYL